MTRRFALVALSCTLLLAATLIAPARAEAATSDAKVGETRAVFNKTGTALRPRPSPLSRPVEQLLPYGARVSILEIRSKWMRVRSLSGTPSTGWLKGSQLVQPYALSEEGRFGRTGSDNTLIAPAAMQRALRRGNGAGPRVARSVTSDEQSAAARAMDDAEKVRRRVSPAEMQRGYDLLDRMVEARKPTMPQVESFVREGQLGRFEDDTQARPTPRRR